MFSWGLGFGGSGSGDDDLVVDSVDISAWAVDILDGSINPGRLSREPREAAAEVELEEDVEDGVSCGFARISGSVEEVKNSARVQVDGEVADSPSALLG